MRLCLAITPHPVVSRVRKVSERYTRELVVKQFLPVLARKNERLKLLVLKGKLVRNVNAKDSLTL